MNRALAFAALLLFGCSSGPSAPRPDLSLLYFESDATPPLGSPLSAGDKVEGIDAPLLLKGLLLQDGDARYVIAALDWCTITSYDYAVFRRKLAGAAGTTPDRVTVHCTHTHSAPTRRTRNRAFVDRTATAAAESLSGALTRRVRWNRIGYGKAKVERFASNRRVLDPYGKMRVRWSRTTDGFLIRAPEGKIDPFIRTVTFFAGPRPLARIHFYASHPQSFYGDGRCHPDVPGWARERLEEEEDIPHLYFTGCAGDITAGKYNDGSPKARAGLIDRLAAGMRHAVAATDVRPVTSLRWSSREIRFARHPQEQPQEGRSFLSSIDLLRLEMGPVDLVFLPGEPFVEYQLHAQGIRPDRFVAVAGYGDGAPGYICTDLAYGQGGYEQQPRASRVGPPTETLLKRALADLLK